MKQHLETTGLALRSRNRKSFFAGGVVMEWHFMSRIVSHKQMVSHSERNIRGEVELWAKISFGLESDCPPLKDELDSGV